MFRKNKEKRVRTMKVGTHRKSVIATDWQYVLRYLQKFYSHYKGFLLPEIRGRQAYFILIFVPILPVLPPGSLQYGALW